jgi:hypothetical protein
LKLNFNSELEIRLQDTEGSLELGGVTLDSPKRSKQELRETADALAVEKRALLHDSEERAKLIYMHVLLVCAMEVGADWKLLSRRQQSSNWGRGLHPRHAP